MTRKFKKGDVVRFTQKWLAEHDDPWVSLPKYVVTDQIPNRFIIIGFFPKHHWNSVPISVVQTNESMFVALQNINVHGIESLSHLDRLNIKYPAPNFGYPPEAFEPMFSVPEQQKTNSISMVEL